MLKNLRCSLCDCELDEEDQFVEYCSICGEKIKKSDETSQEEERTKKE